MDIIVSNMDSTPIYEQITRQIKAKILGGELQPGRRCRPCGCSPGSCASALSRQSARMKKLEREGLIVTQTGRGSFVAPVSSERLREAQLRTVEDHLTDAVQAARLAGLSADESSQSWHGHCLRRRIMKKCTGLHGVCKKYGGFALRNVGFTLPRGTVMGLIGRKRCGQDHHQGGARPHPAGQRRDYRAGEHGSNPSVREKIGVVLENGGFPSAMSAAQVRHAARQSVQKTGMRSSLRCTSKNSALTERRLSGTTQGMKKKLNIAAALSHGAELLILDEATSGLDPVVRDEVLDLLYDFMQGRKSRNPAVQPHHERSGQNRGRDHLHSQGRGAAERAAR